VTQDEMIDLAKQAGWQYAHGESGFEPLWTFAKLVAAKERERIIEANAPELEKANAHIKRLEEHAYDLVGELRVANIKLSMRPPRTWVGLTNEELTDLFYNTNLGQQSAVAQAIALLKQKNT